MKTEVKEKTLKFLNDAMGALYQARYCVAGSEGLVDGKYYPEMDRDAFDAIATLQTKLQNLITDVGKK